MSLSIVVNGREIDTYFHDGKTFIEGRKGSNYELRYRNNTSNKVKVVLSVDGLNVLSGDSDWEKGYIVDPWGSITVPGWSKDPNNVAKFKFSSIKNSYNEHNAAGDSANIGVIGAMVFKKLVYHYPTLKTFISKPVIYDNYPPFYGLCGLATGGGMTSSLRGVPLQASAAVNASFVGDTPIQSIGTEWGNNQEFKTTSVYFNAETNASEVISIYYDSIQGLKQRGIEIRKPKKAEPDPFPGYKGHCPPPISKR